MVIHKLIESETIPWSEQEYVDKLVVKKSTCGIGLLCVFYSVFVVCIGKG